VEGYISAKFVQGEKMSESEPTKEMVDRGGRRRLADRRQYSSSDHFPERRNLRHRRSGNDRRTLLNLKMRKKLERRRMFKKKYSK
jgi:hypothetical protein